jgi:methylated-DNA-[protein]-cysteine S-methyltransferase
MTTLFTQIPSPVGDLLLAGDETRLQALWIDGQRWAPVIAPDWRRATAPFTEAARQLEQYFAGERTVFTLPLRLAGSPFQNAVWQALSRIPFGETRTYGAIAADIGRPSAARAVGAANGQNPFCIVVPCHRLLGSHGGLVDYAAGLEVKRRLLDHEAGVGGREVTPPAAASPPARRNRVTRALWSPYGRQPGGG